MKKNLHKHIGISFLILFVAMQFFSLTENASAVTTVTDQVIVTLNVTEGITITSPADVTMAPPISISANGSIGNAVWTVVTNGAAGYSLAVHASVSPALVKIAPNADSFADYAEAVTGTPELWNVTSGLKEFGYSAFGTDTNSTTWGTGASCGSAGAPTGTAKYVGFKITDKIIATRAVVSPVAGIATTVCFAAQQNAIFANAGTYTATITATASTL